MTARAAGTDKDWEQGKVDGETWARQTGETWEDLTMVPVVQGSSMYKTGFRLGAAKVRNERVKECGCWNFVHLGHCIHTV